ncbi:Uncharacterised protein [Clostridioides difficile]|uniref:hypothetical protein n=1 Tax=Clostridioides difficile TaxID=1496 RepID=UPI000D1E7402|nr:hypothetical protein [Clostridioides difficile]UWD40703.1 hypothetical protein NYF05_15310 [Clostridioides difficile]UWD44489.1 hypothetical protein NYU56_15070 [Clostridioides difficile]VFF94739.1 Uncharacterised protein [Clostridioides difficile]VIG11148.1 Uncharacterised protein [Clostridioides difficile]HBE9438111.1 hypothetical protein [Clostridioides difficile]
MQFILKNYFVITCAVVLVFSLLQGAVISKSFEKYIQKTFELNENIMKEVKENIIDLHKIVEELEKETISQVGLRESMRAQYDTSWKYKMYAILGLISSIQLISILIQPNPDNISKNLAMITMTISFMELMDNLILMKNYKKEVNQKIEHISSELFKLKEIAIDEFVKRKIREQENK